MGWFWVALICFVSGYPLWQDYIGDTCTSYEKSRRGRLQQQPAPNIHGQNMASPSESDSNKRSTILVIIILSTAVILKHTLLNILNPDREWNCSEHNADVKHCSWWHCSVPWWPPGLIFFIYATFARNFRKAYKRMLCSGCQKGNNVSSVDT